MPRSATLTKTQEESLIDDVTEKYIYDHTRYDRNDGRLITLVKSFKELLRDFLDVPNITQSVSNHVFHCALCSRQWTVDSKSELECFFMGICYWCIRERKLTQDQVWQHMLKLKKG